MNFPVISQFLSMHHNLGSVIGSMWIRVRDLFQRAHALIMKKNDDYVLCNNWKPLGHTFSIRQELVLGEGQQIVSRYNDLWLSHQISTLPDTILFFNI